jgi:hypothetical protein
MLRNCRLKIPAAIQASLALNIVLAAGVGLLALHKLSRAPAPSALEPGREANANAFEMRKRTNEAPVFAQPEKLPRYADFASASDRRRWMVDRLRAMGVPNDVLALVARMDFEMQWDSRFEGCWGDRDKMGAVQVEMDRSKDAELRAALGEAGFKQWDQKNMLWEAMSTEVDVTGAEAAAIYELKKKLQRHLLDMEEAKLKRTMDDAEISEADDKAYSEYSQQLKALLGEDRYAKSQQLDDAFKADLLRHELAGVDPSDSQFQELFKAQQQWNKSLLQLDASSPDYAAQLKALDDARDQEYRQVLGASAFDTLQKQQDPGYSQMKKYESLWGLDDHKIDYVFETMRQYEKSVRDYQAQVNASQAQGQGVGWDTVNQTLQKLAAQTQQELQNYLGQDSFNKLQRNRVLKFTGVRPHQ